MKDARNKATLTNNLYVEANKSLAIAESKNKELALKLAIADKDWRSAEVGLRNAEAQMEKRLQRLHYTEIKLATAKQQELELKAEMSTAKEAAQAT